MTDNRKDKKPKFTKEQIELLEQIVKFHDDGRFDIWGDVKGDVDGKVWGNVCGDVKGDVEGSVRGDVCGHVWGDVLGDVEGSIWGDVKGLVGGDVCGDVEGDVHHFESGTRLPAHPHAHTGRGECHFGHSLAIFWSEG